MNEYTNGLTEKQPEKTTDEKSEEPAKESDKERTKTHTAKKRNTKRHSFISAMVVTLVLLAGLSLILYPTVSDYFNSLTFKREITSYRHTVKKLNSSERKLMLTGAMDYNARLINRTQTIRALNDRQRKTYNSLLSLSKSGMMGYIKIDKIHLDLPIFHGTDESVLHSGIGHLEGSSLPVGGIGTHTVLTGHTGLPSMKLFSNIDQLVEGDTFTLHILDEVLTYEVCDISVVLPEEISSLSIEPDKDICTLMTCTPYGINTHRLLVRGMRVETSKEELENEPEQETGQESFLKIYLIFGAAVLLPVAAVVTAIIIVARRGGKRKK